MAGRRKRIPSNWYDFAKLTKLPSPDGQEKIQFVPYHYQYLIIDGIRKLIQDLNWESPRVTILCTKFRQSGISSAIVSRQIWRAASSPSNRCCTILPSRDDVFQQSRRAKESILSVSPEYELKLSSNSLSYLQFMGLGSLTFKSTSARSLSINDYFDDEIAFKQGAAESFGASTPALSAFDDAIITAASTPNGKNNFFYSLLAEACSKVGSPEEIGHEVALGKLYSEDYPGFHWIVKDSTIVVFLGHKCVPKYQDFSLEEMIQFAQIEFKLTENKAWTEFGLLFEDSHNTVFTSAMVSNCAIAGISEKEADEDGVYFASLDPNNGAIGNDFAVLLIYKIVNGKKVIVASWRSNSTSLNKSLYHCTQLLSKFNPKITFVESNGGGKAWAESLVASGWAIEECFTHQSSKAQMVNDLTLSLETSQLQFDSKQQSFLINELLLYKNLGSTANGGVRYGGGDDTDDGVSSLLIGNHYIDKHLQNHDYTPKQKEWWENDDSEEVDVF